MALLALLLTSSALRTSVLPVDRVLGRWDDPPKKVPSDAVVDGPLLGNGRFAAVISSDMGGADMGPSCSVPPCRPSRGEVRNFVGMNDFYAAPTNGFSSCGYPDLDGDNKPGMKQVGGVTFAAPSLGETRGLAFTAEQRPSNATVLVEVGGAGGLGLSIRSWVHATQPLMIHELTYSAADRTRQQESGPPAPPPLDVRVEAWTVLGCGLGPNPAVQDSFLPVQTGTASDGDVL